MAIANDLEYPRLVAIETTNRCNAACSFCPNNVLQRERKTMDDALFRKIVEDCRAFPLPSIEPFLNGEPFVDPKIFDRLAYIRAQLPNTKLCLYTNGNALTPEKIDALAGLGLERLYVSLNTLDPVQYRKVMNLELERTLENLAYLTDPRRRSRIARRIVFRMTRSGNTSWAEQVQFERYCRERGVRCFIVDLFNYKGDIRARLPVPSFPCEHITRLDVLADGRSALCCMDQEGAYSWGALTSHSVLEVFNSKTAQYYRHGLREGRRSAIEPCARCNVFWPSLAKLPLLRTAQHAAAAGYYFLRYRPSGKRRG